MINKVEFRYYRSVQIPVGDVTLHGDLAIPLTSTGIIIFSHGSGSSRFSTRNQQVAKYLQKHNFGTLLFDLLTEGEDQYYLNRFDIDLLTKRLADVTEWLEKLPAANNSRIGYFGASTGAASALRAAAKLPGILAVVSRGGRADLAMEVLYQVKAATLLIVGSEDMEVLLLNREAFTQLECKKKLEVVDGATHLFEEPGKMEIVSKLAAEWFGKHLGADDAVTSNPFAEDITK